MLLALPRMATSTEQVAAVLQDLGQMLFLPDDFQMQGPELKKKKSKKINKLKE